MKLDLTKLFRIPTAILVIGLEFTNLVAFWAQGGNVPNTVQHSRFPFQFSTYVIAALLLFADANGRKRLGRKPIVLCLFCLLLLFTWSMLVRMFNPPLGFTNYEVFRYFALRVNAIAFLLACVVIFDDPRVVRLTKKAIALATLVGVGFNLYDVWRPGFFSNIPGRAAGLYVQPNAAGMALVIGGLIGLSVIRKLWMREAFLICVLVGVLTTLSREAMVAVLILPLAGVIAGVLSFPRLLVGALAAVALCAVLNGSNLVTRFNLLNPDDWNRLTLRWGEDQSSLDRLHVAEKTLQAFEEAPLIGQGFGTAYWWNEAQAHDAYLAYMADCGILGVLVLPGLMFSIRRRDWRFYAFAAVFLLWAFFYHDVLSDDVNFALIAIAIEADESHDGVQVEGSSRSSQRQLRMWAAESLPPEPQRAHP